MGMTPSADQLRRIRESLLSLLYGETDEFEAVDLADALSSLDLTAEQRDQAQTRLLGLLDCETPRAASALARLAVTAEQRARIGEALLAHLARETDSVKAAELAESTASFGLTADQRDRAREILFRLLRQTVPTPGG